MAGLSKIFGGGDGLGPESNDVANLVNSDDAAGDVGGGADQDDAASAEADAGGGGAADADPNPGNFDLTYAEPLGGGADGGFGDGTGHA